MGPEALVIRLVLAADDARGGETSISTTVAINTADPRWQTALVQAITSQATAGARRLRDELEAQTALPGDGFVPLATVVPNAR